MVFCFIVIYISNFCEKVAENKSKEEKYLFRGCSCLWSCGFFFWNSGERQHCECMCACRDRDICAQNGGQESEKVTIRGDT